MANGRPVPDGLLVCHHCDNRLCIEPDHLFIGTHGDNQTDKTVKGRQTRGETNGASKLTTAQVWVIRAAQGSQQTIAARFSISRSLVGLIRARKIWAHV